MLNCRSFTVAPACPPTNSLFYCLASRSPPLLPARNPLPTPPSTSTSLPPTKSIPSTLTPLSAAPSTSSPIATSTAFTLPTSFRNLSPPAGDPSPIATILNFAWPPGTGIPKARGAMPLTKAATSPAAPISDPLFATFCLTRSRIAASPPAAIAPCKVPISSTGKAIPTSPANSRANPIRSTRNGSSPTSAQKNQSTPRAFSGLRHSQPHFKSNIGSAPTRSISTAARRANGKFSIQEKSLARRAAPQSSNSPHRRSPRATSASSCPNPPTPATNTTQPIHATASATPSNKLNSAQSMPAKISSPSQNLQRNPQPTTPPPPSIPGTPPKTPAMAAIISTPDSTSSSQAASPTIFLP